MTGRQGDLHATATAHVITLLLQPAVNAACPSCYCPCLPAPCLLQLLQRLHLLIQVWAQGLRLAEILRSLRLLQLRTEQLHGAQQVAVQAGEGVGSRGGRAASGGQ